MAYDGAAEAADKIKVFVSYAREDTGFASDLVAALQACGFEAYIDQEDIAPGEPWQDRLRGLIESADTVVYVISPDSLTSEHCSWEVDETLRLNKRLLPIVWRDFDDVAVPDALSSLNYTFFNGDRSFAVGLKELSEALRVDHFWIREHTRIGALARRWDQRGRTDALLLRGAELETASAWAARRPRGAPELSDAQVDLIAASKDAFDQAERAARNRRRGLLASVSAVAVAMAGLAVYSFVQSQEATEAKEFAQEAYRQLVETNDELAASYLRLNADIGLLAPPTRNNALSVPGGWFPVAANYSGAVIQLQQGRQIITGILIDGSVVHPEYVGKSFVLTPQFFKSEEELLTDDARLEEFLRRTDALGAEGAAEFEDRPMTRSLVAPGPADTSRSLTVPEPEDPLDEFEGEAFSKPLIVEDGPIERIEQRHMLSVPPTGMAPEEGAGDGTGELAFDPLEQRHLLDEEIPVPVAIDPETGAPLVSARFPTLKEKKALQLSASPLWTTPSELGAEPQFAVYEIEGEVPFGARSITADDFDCDSYFEYSDEFGRYALFGIGGEIIDSSATRSLGIEERLIQDDCVGVCEGEQPVTLLVTTGLDLPTVNDLTYRHATLKGAFGAPVFDLETGKIIGIHQGVIASRLGPQGRVAYGEPILPLIDLIRDDHSIDRRDEDRTAPICFADEQ